MDASMYDEIFDRVQGIFDRYPFSSTDPDANVATAVRRQEALSTLVEVYPPWRLAIEKIYGLLLAREQAIRHGAGKMPVWVPVPGPDVLGGALEPIERLDDRTGGLSEVWLCVSRYWQKTLVVKYLKQATIVERALALAEAKLHGLLHPNIVRIGDVGYLRGPTNDPVPYVAMEFLGRRTLQQWRNEQTHGLSKESAGKITEVILKALQALHSFRPGKILHLDMKPSNIMVLRDPEGPDDEGWLKLIDFGAPDGVDVAVLAAGRESTTNQRIHALTHAYAAKERWFENAKEPNPSWDVYSAGGVLWYLITGHDPKRDLSTGDTICDWNLIKDDSFLREICQKAMADDPEKRYKSAEAFAKDLSAWAEHRPIPGIRKRYKWRERLSDLWWRCKHRADERDLAKLWSVTFGIMGAIEFIVATVCTAIEWRGGATHEEAYWMGGCVVFASFALTAGTILVSFGITAAASRVAIAVAAYLGAAIPLYSIVSFEDSTLVEPAQFALTGMWAVLCSGYVPGRVRIYLLLYGAAIIALVSPINHVRHEPWLDPFRTVLQGWKDSVFWAMIVLSLWNEASSEPRGSDGDGARQEGATGGRVSESR
jgi:hypothetical protein